MTAKMNRSVMFSLNIQNICQAMLLDNINPMIFKKIGFWFPFHKRTMTAIIYPPVDHRLPSSAGQFGSLAEAASLHYSPA